VLAPFVGTFGGIVLGVAVPVQGMTSGSEVLIPYTAASGMALGTATGAMLTPILMAEGLWDTLTFGAFADRPFSWFNTNVQFKAEVDVSKMEAGAGAE
jgi:hypothetical protein